MARPKGKRIAPIGATRDFLLRRIDSGGTPPRLGKSDTASELGELRRQIRVAHGLISELGATPDQRALGILEPCFAIGIHSH
ncbi:hypothetical protein, partial [Klebsiella pneumoniae]|uniref:hypothetical protein n=1 Tax=Klebsiella pneumoniae TaxID=573 RepID=UPI0013D3A670